MCVWYSIPNIETLYQICFDSIVYDLISKFQVGLKSLLRQGLSEPEFYGDLVYKLKKILALIIFQRSLLKYFPIIRICIASILHASWSTQSSLAILLSSSTARLLVGLQTLRRFRFKDLSIDKKVGA